MSSARLSEVNADRLRQWQRLLVSHHCEYRLMLAVGRGASSDTLHILSDDRADPAADAMLLLRAASLILGTHGAYQTMRAMVALAEEYGEDT